MSSKLPKYDYKKQLLEDVFVPRTEPYLPVVVVDFKVMAHNIMKYAESAKDVAGSDDELLFSIFRAQWAYALNRGPDTLERFPHTVIVVDDVKQTMLPAYSEASSSGSGYWRHIECAKLGLPEYKGGRKKKPEYFDLINQAGYTYILNPKSKIRYFCKQFFEADDFAGELCRIKRAAGPRSIIGKRQLILSTVDGDWSGLASDKHEILWSSTGPWLPRLRSEREVCDYYLRKEAIRITEAKGCYAVKSERGDLGDNLFPGTPLRFFDLYEEDEEWKFSKEDKTALRKALRETHDSTRSDHLESAAFFIKRKGLFLPEIGPTWEEDKMKFFKNAVKARIEGTHPELSGSAHKSVCLQYISQEEQFAKCKQLIIDNKAVSEKIKVVVQQLAVATDPTELNKQLKTLQKVKSGILAMLKIFKDGGSC